MAPRPSENEGRQTILRFNGLDVTVSGAHTGLDSQRHWQCSTHTKCCSLKTWRAVDFRCRARGCSDVRGPPLSEAAPQVNCLPSQGPLSL
jgi:hypothetical protein